jgi:hypothetical protein
MNALGITGVTPLLAAIEAAGLPGLRIAFTLAVIGFAAIGVYIYRGRHQFFDRDPEVENDFAAARHVRLENMIFVWGALMIVLFCIFIGVWRE